MTRATSYMHEFVEFVPEELDDSIVYVSIDYATASHKCMCGCGSKIVTPLAPNRWSIRFDGETVSLTPSIGNWSYACQSHYSLRRGRVEWARRWSPDEITAARPLATFEDEHGSSRAKAVRDSRPAATHPDDGVIARLKRRIRSR